MKNVAINAVPASDKFTFSGFKRKEKFNVYVPDIIFDLFPKFLSPIEIRVLDYLVFRVLGLGHETVSLNQMLNGRQNERDEWSDYGAGVKHRRTLTRTLKSLEEKGLIERKRNVGENGNNRRTSYSLLFDSTGLDETERLERTLQSKKKYSLEEMSTLFDGFEMPTDTSLPSLIFNRLLGHLSNGEYLVLRYICRHTFGFKKTEDTISLSQMTKGIMKKDGKSYQDYGCGLKKKNTIIKSANHLHELGIIEKVRRYNQKGKYISSSYKLKFRKDSPRDINLPPEETTGELPRDMRLQALGTSGYPPRDMRLQALGTSGYIQNKEVQNNNKQTKEKQQQQQGQAKHFLESENVVVVNFLKKQGFSELVAKQLAQGHSLVYVEEKVNYLEFEKSRKPNGIPNALGWLRSAIEQDYGKPAGYKSIKEREKEEQEKQQLAEKTRKYQENFRNAQLQKEAQEKQQKKQQLQAFQVRYNTTELDLENWKKLKSFLKESANHSFVAHALEGLRVNRDEIILGVWNEFAMRKLTHPKLVEALKRDIQTLFGFQDNEIVFEKLYEEKGEKLIKIDPQ